MITHTHIVLPDAARQLLENAVKQAVCFETTQELADAATSGPDQLAFEVKYDVPGKGSYTEAVVHRVTNGISANYTDAYMRRRDPDTMLIADDLPSDKERFEDRYGYPFSDLRAQTFEWLSQQELSYFFFRIGKLENSPFGMAIAPANAAFFSLGLAMLQHMVRPSEIPQGQRIYAVVYVAPVFRHTHFGGKQVVVHSRQSDHYEIYS